MAADPRAVADEHGYLFVGGPADGKVIAVPEHQPTWVMLEASDLKPWVPWSHDLLTARQRPYRRRVLYMAGDELVWALDSYVDVRLTDGQATDIALSHIMRQWGAKEYRREEGPHAR